MNFLNRFKYARDSYLITILIILIAVMVNFIAARHFIRVDLTKNQIYAVSDASKNIMGEMEDVVTVKVFFSDKLPPNLFTVKQYVDDILEELTSYSKGNLIVSVMDPSDPNVMNEALQLGIPQIRMNILEKDKFEVKNGFLGIAVIYGDKTEILPVVQNILNVEYDLVAAIKKVTADANRAVAFLTGHDEPSLKESIGGGNLDNTLAVLKRAMDRNYEVKEVNLESGDSLSGVSTLLVVGPKTAITEKEQYMIDQFVLGGGNLVMFVDSIDVSQALETSVLDLDLDEFLEHYGLGVEKQLALDASNETASFSQGFVNYIVPYPLWVKSVRQYFDTENPIVTKLDAVVLPWASPINVSGKEGVKSTALFSTTPNAWSQSEPFNLDPSFIQNVSEKQQYPLGVLLEGEFDSYFNDKDIPEGLGEDHMERSLTTGRVLLVGNSRFITDRFVSMFGQNLPFAMNAIDFLTLDESLISIRSKTAYDLALNDLSARDRQIVKFAGILMIPILVIVFGVARAYMRRGRKYIL